MPALPPTYPAFGLLFCPLSPQPPSPAGKGEIFLFSYARGFAPCIPGIKPPAAFTVPAAVVPGGGLAPGGTCYPCHCGTLWGACPLCHPPGTQMAGIASAAGVQPRGCKGRSPLHKKTISLPLPAGKGGGGMGAGNQTKGRVGGRQSRQAPRGHHSGKAGRRPPPCPPAGNADGRSSQCRRGSARGRRAPPAYPPIPPFFAPPLDKTQAYVYNVA